MKIREFDTICAIATGFGEGGIGIVRISGNSAFDIAEKIFSPLNTTKNNLNVSSYKTHTLTYGIIKDGEDLIDEVLLAIMKAPRTYTCEDVVEINCHGGKASLQRVLQTVVKNGARIAENGEFTKRAFLNGRIDLSKAQAVIDVINAKTELGHKSAISRLEGKLKNKIDEYRNDILTMTAHIEASIDYPEHDDETITYNTIRENTQILSKKITKLLETADTGKIINDGVKTVILGKPNVGKSSILNMLLEEERAIVSDIAGTTRDVLRENLNVNGIALNIVDTAGIRETDDTIEKIGVQKSKQYAEDADLILLVLDSTQKLDEEDFDLLKFIEHKKSIILCNKYDLGYNLDIPENKSSNMIQISAKTEFGSETLKSKIQELFFKGEINVNEDILISNERNKASLYNCLKSLSNVLETVNSGMPEDFISMDLIEAYRFLGEITGESLEEDIIDKIFSEFCLGK